MDSAQIYEVDTGYNSVDGGEEGEEGEDVEDGEGVLLFWLTCLRVICDSLAPQLPSHCVPDQWREERGDSLRETGGLEIDQSPDWRGAGFYVNNSPAENLFGVPNGKFSLCFCVQPHNSDRCPHASPLSYTHSPVIGIISKTL